MKKKVVLGLLIVVVSGLVIFKWSKSEPKQPQTEELTTEVAVSSQSQQKKTLANYPLVAKALERVPVSEQLTPIPGLKQTVTFNATTGVPELCDDMTPQGLAVSDKEIFISAYCRDHTHNSVIYALQRSNQELLATIPVAGIPHLGGIIYDTDHRNLWLATEKDNHAAVSAISAATINEWGNKAPKGPVNYDQELELPNIPKASLLSYLEPFLVVGYFDKANGGELAMYPFDKKGNPSSLVEKKAQLGGLHDPNQLITTDVNKIVKKTQGIAYFDHYMFLAQSYGNHDSMLYVIDLYHAPHGFTAASAFKKIKFPPYLEQVTVSGDRLLAVFESGAKAYRANTDRRVDHVIQLDVKNLIKNHD